MNWYNIEESNMEDYQNYIEKYFIEDGVEYEGFVKNTHPSQNYMSKCVGLIMIMEATLDFLT
ncbi:MAG: hypothetical protein IPG24_23505 [Leptospiraceae bacterium]|nr:hypothetical protein [Leptospiraceae bacterium]